MEKLLPLSRHHSWAAHLKLFSLDRLIPLLRDLNAIRWVRPIFVLIERFAGLEEYFDNDEDIPQNAIAKALVKFGVSPTDEQIADALSRLDCFTYRAKSPTVLWNPLEQSFQTFLADHKGHVRIFQWDVEHPEPAIIKDWLLGQVDKR